MLALVLVLHAWQVLQGVTNGLEGPHDFRQSQTAISTYYLAKDGLTLTYETPVLGAPYSLPFEFPTYQLTVLAVKNLFRCPLDLAGRLVSIAFFYLTLPLVAFVLRRLALPVGVIACALTAVLVTPAYIFYTRAFLIESTALFAAWLFLAGVASAVWHPAAVERFTAHRVIVAGALLALAVIAAVTKITTFAVHAGAAVTLSLFYFRAQLADARATKKFSRLPWRPFATLLATIGLGLAIAVAWTDYTDAVKLHNASPIAHQLTSSALHDWNFGARGSLLSLRTWQELYRRCDSAAFGSFVPLGMLCLIPPLLRSRRTLIGCFVLVWLSGAIVFTNLYAVHDYYWYASAVFLALGYGIAMGTALEGYHEIGSWPRWALLVGSLVGAQFIAYHYSTYHFVQKVPPHEATDLATTIRTRTPSESSIVIFGYDWNPLIAYYAERRTFMVPWDNQLFFRDGSQQALQAMVKDGHSVSAVVFYGSEAKDARLQERALSRLSGEFVPTWYGTTAVVFYRVSP